MMYFCEQRQWTRRSSGRGDFGAAINTRIPDCVSEGEVVNGLKALSGRINHDEPLRGSHGTSKRYLEREAGA